MPPPEVASHLYEVIEAAEGLDESTIPHAPFMGSAPTGRQNQTVFDADNPNRMGY